MKHLNYNITLESELDRDAARRKKELVQLSTLLKSISRSQTNIGNVAARSFYPAVYAQLEGFVRNATNRAITHMQKQFNAKRAMPTSWIAAAIWNTLQRNIDSFTYKDIQKELDKATVFQLNLDGIPLRGAMAGNVNYNTICSLLDFIGSEPSLELQSQESFLNLVLLKRRNQVAHGQLIEITIVDTVDAIERISKLIDEIKISIVNSGLNQAN
jgi:hypothetical protein